MKGVIILPKYLEEYWVPKETKQGPDFGSILSANAVFFYCMRDVFGFKLRYADEVDVDIDTDIVFMFGVPYHNRPNLIPGILELQKSTKLVMWPGDLQCYNNKECYENKLKVYDRCDLIISPAYEYFVKLYPESVHKYKFMPKFFSPYNRYSDLSFNDIPKMRCLMVGSLNEEVYPLRSFIIKSRLVDYRKPVYVGDRYANLLHSYFCCIATSSIFNYVVAKHYEIPATGSLLLANETTDLGKAGFISNRHYVPITKENVYEKITQCLKNPNEYSDVRREGMEFVRKNHSINNRMDFLKSVFEDLLNK